MATSTAFEKIASNLSYEVDMHFGPHGNRNTASWAKEYAARLVAALGAQEPTGWWNPSYPALSVQLTKPAEGGGWGPFYTVPQLSQHEGWQRVFQAAEGVKARCAARGFLVPQDTSDLLDAIHAAAPKGPT